VADSLQTRLRRALAAWRSTREAARILRSLRDDCEATHGRSVRLPFLLAWRVFPWRVLLRGKSGHVRPGRRERLWKRAHHEMTARSSPDALPFVFTPWALRVQGAQVRRAFRDVLGLGLPESAVKSLRHYRSAAVSIRDFLEFCGLPMRLETVMGTQTQLAMFSHDTDVRRHRAQELQRVGGPASESHEAQRRRVLRDNHALRRAAVRRAAAADSRARADLEFMNRVQVAIAVQDRALRVFHAVVHRMPSLERTWEIALGAYDRLLSLGLGELDE